MMTIFWKDIRENLKWAAVVLVGTAIATCITTYMNRAYGGPEAVIGWFIRMQDVTAAAAVIGGLGMGILQFAFESTRDRYALLVHRPLSRTRIFVGKSLGGLSLLFLAILLPPLISALWVSRSYEVFYPFRWAMIWPSVVDTLGAAMYYFAGVLITVRQARWYASRVLAVGLPVVCSLITYFVPKPWEAVIDVLIGSVIMAAGALGAFGSAGAYAPLRWPARIAIGLSLLPTLYFLLILPFAAVDASRRPSVRDRLVHYFFDRQGRVLHATGASGSGSVIDLEGHPFPEYAKALKERGNHDLFPPALQTSWQTDSPVFRPGYRLWYWYPTNIGIDKTLNEQWNFDAARQLVVGSAVMQDRKIGIISPSGFYPDDEAPPDRFPAQLLDTHTKHILAFHQAVYLLHLAERRVEKIYTASADDAVLGAGWTSLPDGQSRTMIVTRKSIRLLDSDAKPILTTSNLPDAGYIRVVMLDAPGHLILRNHTIKTISADRNTGTVKGVELAVEVGPDGSIVRRYELPQEWTIPIGIPFDYVATSGSLAIAILRLYGVLAQAPGLTYFDIIWDRIPRPTSFDISHGGTLALAIGSGALAAVLTLVLARRYAFCRRRAIAWTIGNFLLGIPGLLLLLCLQDWPALLQCPSCSRKRPVTLDFCPRCLAPWPVPVLDGTEIFE